MDDFSSGVFHNEDIEQVLERSRLHKMIMKFAKAVSGFGIDLVDYNLEWGTTKVKRDTDAINRNQT